MLFVGVTQMFSITKGFLV